MPHIPAEANFRVTQISSDIEEAVRHADLGLERDPYNKYVGYDVGEVYRWAGDYEKSIEVCRSIPQTPPSMQGHIAANQVALGNMDEARKEMSEYLEKAAKMMPRPPTSVDEWRAYWKQISIHPSGENFAEFFDQLLLTGLVAAIAGDRTGGFILGKEVTMTVDTGCMRSQTQGNPVIHSVCLVTISAGAFLALGIV